MKATNQLSTEHQAILKALKLLQAVAEAWTSGQPEADKDAASLIEFFKVFSDRCHHGKEENLLFPMLNRAGMPIQSGPLGIMLFEHEEGRKFVRNMNDALAAGRADDFALNANRYRHLLEDHIAKEDNVLYVMADGYLTAEDDAVLIQGFEAVEREMGEETHDRFHQMLNTLEPRYLRRAEAS